MYFLILDMVKRSPVAFQKPKKGYAAWETVYSNGPSRAESM
jgi:hypothetical protein